MRIAGRCAFVCDAESDCHVSSDCSARMRCEVAANVCTDDDDCIPFGSSWLTPCMNDDGCLDGESCITVLGEGRCAANDLNNECSSRTAPVPWPRFGAKGTVTVCQDSSARCDFGTCRGNCNDTGPAGCSASRRGKACVTSSGLCGCNTQADCTGVPGASMCNVTTRLCECTRDDDCDNVPGHDICVAGRCGCSGAAACANAGNIHTGALPACDPRP